MDLKKLFGSSLRQCRRARGLTQAQLAEATELSVEMVGRLERGRAAPSFETIVALAEVLKVPVAVLFGAEPTGIESERRELLDLINGLLAQTSDKDLRVVRRVLRALLGD